jgi:hypothetical protein
MLTANYLNENYEDFLLKFMTALASNSSITHDGSEVEYDIDYTQYADVITQKAAALYYAFYKEVKAQDEMRKETLEESLETI